MILFFKIFTFSFCSPDWKLMCRLGWHQIWRSSSLNKILAGVVSRGLDGSLSGQCTKGIKEGQTQVQ